MSWATRCCGVNAASVAAAHDCAAGLLGCGVELGASEELLVVDSSAPDEGAALDESAAESSDEEPQPVSTSDNDKTVATDAARTRM